MCVTNAMNLAITEAHGIPVQVQVMIVQGFTLIVVSSEPEKTRLEDAARARTAPLCPVSVARHLRVLTSQTRTCRSHIFSHTAPPGSL